MSLKDHFSGHAELYASARPGYSDELFAFLASQASCHDLAWDCATGNGQAAHSLAQYFNRVVASDGSAEQIRNAKPGNNIEYTVAEAGVSFLPEASVDLVTVAQALHWFDFDSFNNCVKQSLKPGGLIAVWSYETTRITPAIDRVVDYLYDDILQGYWPAERRHIENAYIEIPFPFEQLPTPQFTMEVVWNFEQLWGYFLSWSAVQRYFSAHEDDGAADTVFDNVYKDLKDAWGDVEQRRVSWPLNFKLGRAG